MKRRKLISLIGLAQQLNPAPLKRIGILDQFRCQIAPTPDDPLTRRLAELGWIEGRNFVFDCVSTVDRWGQLVRSTRPLPSSAL